MRPPSKGGSHAVPRRSPEAGAAAGDPRRGGPRARLRARGEVWIAPHLGPERWAVFVTALGLTRRIYVRREALLDPVAHLYRAPRPDIPPEYQSAHAWIG